MVVVSKIHNGTKTYHNITFQTCKGLCNFMYQKILVYKIEINTIHRLQENMAAMRSISDAKLMGCHKYFETLEKCTVSLIK